MIDKGRLERTKKGKKDVSSIRLVKDEEEYRNYYVCHLNRVDGHGLTLFGYEEDFYVLHERVLE
jgi:hypothetical protein